MFSRKHDTQGTALPQEWLDKAKSALDSRFEAFNEAYEFFVFGEVYSDELLIIVSAVSRNIELSPISFFISFDVHENDKNIDQKQVLENMLNTSELFFEEVFDTDNWSDYSSLWLETEYKKTTFFYKATRENIYLTIEANKLLAKERS